MRTHVDALSEFPPPRTWSVRLASGLQRRMQYAWRRLSNAAHSAPAAAACAGLLRHIPNIDGGVPLLGGDKTGSCSATGLVLPALAACGQREVVERLVNWLLRQQDRAGMFADGAGQPCRLATADALNGLVAISSPVALQKFSGLGMALERACRALARDPADHAPAALGSLGSWVSPALQLVPLAALYQAARRLNDCSWQQTAIEAATRLKREHDLCRWNMPTHLLGAVIQAMLDLEWYEDANRALALPSAAQQSSGETPALVNVRWTSSAGLARLARCWQQTKEHARADAALAALYRRQSASGAFLGSWGPRAAYHPRRHTVGTAGLVLQAAFDQVASNFERQALKLESTIEADDGRLLAVRDFLAGLPPGSCIADIGCGRGRYLHWLVQWFPQFRWVGIDASNEALSRLAPPISHVRGDLLDLPAADGQFDAVFCVEALEHSLLPHQAIAELCRVTRPGGRVLVIDKQHRRQALSQHEPWEIWFKPDEICRWLQPDCEAVAVTPVAHGPQVNNRLFLAWMGVRRQAAMPAFQRAA